MGRPIYIGGVVGEQEPGLNTQQKEKRGLKTRSSERNRTREESCFKRNMVLRER